MSMARGRVGGSNGRELGAGGGAPTAARRAPALHAAEDHHAGPPRGRDTGQRGQAEPAAGSCYVWLWRVGASLVGHPWPSLAFPSAEIPAKEVGQECLSPELLAHFPHSFF